jgi:hypothetical protein
MLEPRMFYQRRAQRLVFSTGIVAERENGAVTFWHKCSKTLDISERVF